MKLICLAAILKDEEYFLDEWLLYHLMIGVDHIFLYDDSLSSGVAEIIQPYEGKVTLIPWAENHHVMQGRNRQTKAYTDAAFNRAKSMFEWIAFIDIDEFIVLRKHNSLKEFLSGFKSAGAVSLTWHVFGHNGQYDDPKGLVTATLTRRRSKPHDLAKSLTRISVITGIDSAHHCKIGRQASWVDANHKRYNDVYYWGKTEVAHINHYQCRSFLRWTKRVERGDAAFEIDTPVPSYHDWRFNEEENLKKFVTSIAVYCNEYVDEFMLRYRASLVMQLNWLKTVRTKNLNC